LVPKLGDADGVGLLMSAPSGLTEIDFEGDGDAWLKPALEQFGETSVKIRTATGKAKLWYRDNGEGVTLGPFDNNRSTFSATASPLALRHGLRNYPQHTPFSLGT